MTGQYDKAVAEVNETFNFYMSMLAERKAEVVKELEKLYIDGEENLLESEVGEGLLLATLKRHQI